jgi:pimeloyl-ACP methyl ester carboxylesterase
MINLYKKTSRPSLFLAFTEAGRALTELGISYPYQNFVKPSGTGDGHPVMILPGFMSTKFSTGLLREFVSKSGYTVYDWGIKRNLGKVEYMDYLLQRLEKIQKHHGAAVSLIGWSLGGVFARELAKARPDLIRQVITLGSPFRDITHPNNIAWLYTLISGGKTVKESALALLETLPHPAPVPTTAIYSKEDGIVKWEMCLEEVQDDWHQNIQVRGSHCGLGVNTSVFWIIADRLKQKPEDWTHFRPSNVIEEWLFYPSL